MAIGGGTFTTQNKIIPGAYINTVSSALSTASASDRGVVAWADVLEWGEKGKIIELTYSEFVKNSFKLFGYVYTDESLKDLREIFKNANKVLFYNLNLKGTKASNTFGTAKYTGSRGNDIKTVITYDVDDTTKYIVNTYVGTVLVDSQTVASASELIGNDFVDFNKTATLAENAGESMTGGLSADEPDPTKIDLSPIVNAVTAYLTALESQTFNVFSTALNKLGDLIFDDQKLFTPNAMFAEWVKDQRENYGKKIQAVVVGYDADYEGVININENQFDALAWTVGVAAGTAVNKSALNKVYDGEFDIPADFTQADIEEAIENGEFVLHKVGDELRVLADINSLVTVTDEKGEIFKSNQTVRVMDQIATDAANIFATKYLGKVQNDASGRESFWGDIRSILKSLVNIHAIEDFDDGDITVEAGNEKGSIVFNCAVVVIGTMEKLYMTCVIS